jgi:hypothetical protein
MKPPEGGTIDLTSYRPGPWHLLLDRSSGQTRRKFRFASEPCQGWYERAGGEVAAIYRDGDHLYFRAGDREWELGPATSTRWEQTGEKAGRFAFVVDDRPVYSIDYPLPIGWLDRSDVNFELSQKDFFLAVHDLVKAPSSWASAFRGAR